MSQLVRAIKAVDTGNRKIFDDSYSPLFKECVEVTQQVNALPPSIFCCVSTSKEYRIGVKIENNFWIQDRIASDAGDDAVEELIRLSKRKIIEAIYGEFRQNFYQIQTALNMRDYAQASCLLTKFEQKMFEDI